MSWSTSRSFKILLSLPHLIFTLRHLRTSLPSLKFTEMFWFLCWKKNEIFTQFNICPLTIETKGGKNNFQVYSLEWRNFTQRQTFSSSTKPLGQYNLTWLKCPERRKRDACLLTLLVPSYQKLHIAPAPSYFSIIANF